MSRKSNKSLTAIINEYKKYEKGVKTKSGVVKSIRVTENQAEFYLDGQRLLPTVSKGKIPRTFVFDNQLYAPIESVGQSLLGGQKNATWNEQKKAIYFGVSPQGKVRKITDLGILERNNNVTIGHENSNYDISFQVLDYIYYPSNIIKGYSTWGGPNYNRVLLSSEVKYNLEGNYSSLKGTLAIPYNRLGASLDGAVEFYSVDSYGEKKLISRNPIKAGDPFVSVDVNLSGVEYLSIIFKGDTTILHNVTIESLLD